ncbi:MAG: hypothetical protein R3E01_33385 [Pirellulaceae bacterium]
MATATARGRSQSSSGMQTLTEANNQHRRRMVEAWSCSWLAIQRDVYHFVRTFGFSNE